MLYFFVARKSEAELFIRKMFDVCNQGLEADKQVKIKWLGTFKVQATKDRESINVSGTHVQAVSEGDTVTAYAKLVHKGRTLHTWEVAIKNTAGEEKQP